MVAELGFLLAALSAALAALLVVLAVQRVLLPFLAAARADAGRAFLPALGDAVRSRLASFVRPRVPGWYRERVGRALVLAGEPDTAAEDVLASQLAGLVAGAGLGLAIDGALGALVAGAAGAGLPLAALRRRVIRRRAEIVRALPYALDLLTLAMEAGLDFGAALAKVAEKGRPGPLRDELSLVMRQLRMGKTREEALRALMERVHVAGLSSVVRAVIQAERMGTRLGIVLRLQAEQMRQERWTRAEKLAGEAPVKMLFPLLAFIFPTVFLVIFGPLLFTFAFGAG